MGATASGAWMSMGAGSLLEAAIRVSENTSEKVNRATMPMNTNEARIWYASSRPVERWDAAFQPSTTRRALTQNTKSAEIGSTRMASIRRTTATIYQAKQTTTTKKPIHEFFEIIIIIIWNVAFVR